MKIIGALPGMKITECLACGCEHRAADNEWLIAFSAFCVAATINPQRFSHYTYLLPQV
jgi:hypothetical protein